MDGTAVATGLGWDAELRFNEVMVPAAGRYILRIIYAAGDCRDISIQANDGEVINTYLHSTSGWEFPHMGVCGRKGSADRPAGGGKTGSGCSMIMA